MATKTPAQARSCFLPGLDVFQAHACDFVLFEVQNLRYG